MLLFLLVVPLVWGGAHVYVGRALISQSKLPRGAHRALWALLWALCALTVAGSTLGRAGLDGAWMDALYWVLYVYMGAFSLLLAGVVLRDLGRLGLRLWRRARRAEPVDEGRRALLGAANLGIASAAGALTAVGAHEALRGLEVVEVKVPIQGLPPELEGFTITQISDLHVGPTIRRPFVEAVVARANALGSELIAITGDLVDGYVAQRREDVAPLAALSAPEGVFYVTGNHEYYWGAGPWIEEARRLGMVPLINEHRVVRRGAAALAVAGVTDRSAGQFTPDQPCDPARALAGAPPEAIKLLLAHQPRSAFQAASAGAHLQLSGHTHGGQFAPWSLVVWLAQPFVAGLHTLEQMQLYVSRGTGYWGPPLRLAATPEITRLTLTRA